MWKRDFFHRWPVMSKIFVSKNFQNLEIVQIFSENYLSYSKLLANLLKMKDG